MVGRYSNHGSRWSGRIGDDVNMVTKKKGLYANIHAKRKRIKAGSKEKMRKAGSKGAPTRKQFNKAAKTAKKRTYRRKK